MSALRRGVYPGSFDPPTVAHLAIAEAARARHLLDEIHLVVSRVALAKEDRAGRPHLDHRLEVLEAETRQRPWLRVSVTERQLIADIAEGFDVVIMGADKWAQIHDTAFYADTAHRDRALAALPTVALVPRAPHPTPAELRLDLAPWVAHVSSTRARAGRRADMSEAARRFDEATGAWTDPARYRRWRRSRP